MKNLFIILFCAALSISCSTDDTYTPKTVTAPLSQAKLPPELLGRFVSREGVYNYLPGEIEITEKTFRIYIEGWVNRTIKREEVNINYVPDCFIQITIFNPDGTIESINIGDGSKRDYVTFTFDKPDSFQEGGVTTLAFDREKEPVKEVEQPEINM